MATFSREVAQTLTSATSKQGLNREARAALLRVVTEPECPEDNLRELTWDSNPNSGIAREREEKRDRENFPTKSSNLRLCWACLQNKGLSQYQRKASWLRTSPSSTRGSQAAGRQPEPERGNLRPRDSILYQTASRLPVANQVFLGSWMVDICQEGHSQRSAPQRRYMAQLRRCFHCAPRGGDKMSHPDRKSVLTKHLVACAAQTWEGHKMQVQPSLHLCGVHKNLNLRGLDLGSACNPGPTWENTPAEQPGTWAE